MQRNPLILVSLIALAGCSSQSDVQSNYTKRQNSCREQVSRLFAAVGNTTADQASLGTSFSECMNKSGWNVAMPRSGTPVAQNPPTGSPSTDLSAATKVASPGPAPNPPSGSPSTAPIAAAKFPPVAPPVQAIPPAPPVSRYQPARPTTTPEVTFGKGPGRNF